MKKICVLGSINIDKTYQVPKLPDVGESVVPTGRFASTGGKGFNQAVAARRAGCQVSFIGKLGPDGDYLYELLTREGIDHSCTFQSKDIPTGSAVIIIAPDGKNMIVVDVAANKAITAEEMARTAPLVEECDIAVTQLETNMEAATLFFARAKACGKPTVLNPAPVDDLPPALLRSTDILVPNETELAYLIGVPVTDDYALLYSKMGPFFQAGVKIVIVTLGEHGVLLCDAKGFDHLPASKVNAVDSTAAGDSFIGALVSRMDPSHLDDRAALLPAVAYAQNFAGYVVSHIGAYDSMPPRSLSDTFAST
ncbi:ribokinase [Zongyangia hominis]|uniref:Ribokinase n=1 Tax=Zongyangia hominis TaxID=2763677 RepID=A0A926EEA1_9FIRM|nr:ribokinase [Zongyangia hominis]MBC8570844.1 ribokinase [Zongyangia hominis]